MFTLDTNPIIYYLHNDQEVFDLLQSLFDRKTLIFISTITELELFSFPRITNMETKQVDHFLETLKIIPVTSEIARIGSYLRRLYRLKTADSVIAATAIFTQSTLVTRNINDFRKIPGLQLLAI